MIEELTNFPQVLFWLAGVAALVFFVFNVARRGGFRAAMFNARIADTTGQVEAVGPRMMTQHIKVHRLDRGGEQLVGIEVVSKSAASYQMLPVVLSKDQAQALAALLQQATVK